MTPTLVSFMAQESGAGAPPAVPPWLQIISVIATLITGYYTVRFGLLTAKKTRLETIRLERELEREYGQVSQATTAAVDDSGRGVGAIIRRPMNVKVQGYIVRFIIMSLAQIFWNIFTNGFSLVIAGSVSGLYAFGGTSYGPLVNLAGLVPGMVAWLVTLLIFLTIGLPLLKDILDDLGIRYRLLWFWDVGRRRVDVAEH